MFMFKRSASVVGLLIALSGCEIPYVLDSTEASIDPATGDKILIYHWRYDDGYTTTTTKVIPKDGAVEQRRGERQLPPPRFTE